MAGAAVRVGSHIVNARDIQALCLAIRRLGRLRMGPQLTVVAAVQRHQRRAGPTCFAIPRHGSPAQLQWHQYQEKTKQSGAHPKIVVASRMYLRVLYRPLPRMDERRPENDLRYHPDCAAITCLPCLTSELLQRLTLKSLQTFQSLHCTAQRRK